MIDIKITTKVSTTQRAFTTLFFEGGRGYHQGYYTKPDNSRPETLYTNGKNPCLAFNITAMKDISLDDARRTAGGTSLRSARRWSDGQLLWICDGNIAEEQIEQLLTGLLLADYEFTMYRSGATGASSCTKVTIAAGKNLPRFKAALARVQSVNSGVATARDLANTPANDLPPLELAARAKLLAKSLGLAYKQLDHKQLISDGYTGIVNVGQGSVNPPVLFSLTYTPQPRTDITPLFLVGKGITFDTGGISIKPWDGMWDMKADMGGAAGVIGAMHAIALLKPPIPVTAVVASAENMPDGKAYRPGDVLRYRNGRTVEIHSTDAEGRLVLADALIYAQETLGARRIIEFSTLTGACARALGRQYIGMMSKDAPLKAALMAAAEQTGELCWELPLHPEYRGMLKSSLADVKNVGGPLAGAQTAGMFLYEFIEPETSYAHLDIAGVFLADKVEKYWSQPGATGAGVRLAARLAENLASPGQQ